MNPSCELRNHSKDFHRKWKKVSLLNETERITKHLENIPMEIVILLMEALGSAMKSR